MPRMFSFVALLFLGTPAGFSQEVDPEDLRPGLLTTYSDTASPPRTVQRLEPTIALNLAADEATHPRLAANGGTARWRGYLQVGRTGKYVFQVRVRGRFTLRVGGKVLLQSESMDKVAVFRTPSLELTSGSPEVVAEFLRAPGPAVLELLWSGPGFRLEPIAADAWGHLPTERSPEFLAGVRQDQGRLLFEEHACIKCHRADANDPFGKTFAERQGPNLSKVGKRIYPRYLYDWLGDPKKHRPATVMPAMFSTTPQGDAERYAVTMYLSTLGGPLQPDKKLPNPKDLVRWLNNGKVVFTTYGCAACHQNESPAGKADPTRLSLLTGSASSGAAVHYPLGDLSSKTTPKELAAFLLHPLETHPYGRMPNMNLTPGDANDIAYFLCAPKEEQPLPFEMPAAPAESVRQALLKSLQIEAKGTASEQWRAAGKVLLSGKGCVNCHQIQPESEKRPLPILASAKSPAALRAKPDGGCVSATPPDGVPNFKLSETARADLQAFLTNAAEGAGSPAVAFQTRAALQRFNCLNCHVRDGEGGLGADLTEQMRKLEKAEAADAIAPPVLSGVGHKLRTTWLKQVLTEKGRSRPWMNLRMPQYGTHNVGFLAEGLAKIEGADPDDTIVPVRVSSSILDAGRVMMGKNGMGCISCHDINGVVGGGTRGPDLATTTERVRYEWYRRWLEQPQRMAPGTRMPQVFLDGKSLLTTVLNGDADAQADAMWAYMSLGSSLPLPAGLEPPKGRILLVGDRPEILRTFLPEAGSKGIAVGYSSGVNYAFDAAQCRMVFAWGGNFLDVSPVWDNRGGAPAKILGPRFWTAPPGNPWAISGSQEPPDFLTRAKDPAFGAPLPDGVYFAGERLLHYEGMTLDKLGYPSFRYRLESGPDAMLRVIERPEPLRNAVALGILRKFTLTGTTDRIPWFFAGEATGTPYPATAAKPASSDAPTEYDLTTTPLLVLPQPGSKAIVLKGSGPNGTKWLIRKQGSTWSVFLKFPPAKEGVTVVAAVAVWPIAREEESLIKPIVTAE